MRDDFVVDAHVAAGFDLVAYASGRGGARFQRLIESHLADCHPCATTVDELRETLMILEVFRPDP